MGYDVNLDKLGKTTAINNDTKSQETEETQKKSVGLFSVSNDNTDAIELSISKDKAKVQETQAAQETAATNATTQSSNDAGTQIDSLNAEIEQLTAQIEGKTVELIAQRKELAQKEDTLNTQQEEYLDTQQTANEKDDQLQQITRQIDTQNTAMQRSAKRAKEKAKTDAEKNYDPEECKMSLEAYVNQQVNNAAPDLSYKGELNTNISLAQSLVSEITELKSALASQATEIKATQSSVTELKRKVTTTHSSITEYNDSITSKQEEIKSLVDNMVPSDEWAIVNENNVDMEETLSDGSPRYVIAKSSTDNSYHIFDKMDSQTNDEGNVYYKSLAEKYKTEPEPEPEAEAETAQQEPIGFNTTELENTTDDGVADNATSNVQMQITKSDGTSSTVNASEVVDPKNSIDLSTVNSENSDNAFLTGTFDVNMESTSPWSSEEYSFTQEPEPTEPPTLEEQGYATITGNTYGPSSVPNINIVDEIGKSEAYQNAIKPGETDTDISAALTHDLATIYEDPFSGIEDYAFVSTNNTKLFNSLSRTTDNAQDAYEHADVLLREFYKD